MQGNQGRVAGNHGGPGHRHRDSATLHEETPVEQLNNATQCGAGLGLLVTTVVLDTATVTALVSGAGARGGPFIITNISRENLLIPSLAAGAGAGASAGKLQGNCVTIIVQTILGPFILRSSITILITDEL